MAQTTQSAVDLDGVELMDGEDVLHTFRPHWSQRLHEGRLGVITSNNYLVTDERVIKHKSTLTGTETSEYPIRDIDQLQANASNAQQLVDIGNIQFSVGGGGDKISIGGVPDHQDIINTIREQQRRISEA